MLIYETNTIKTVNRLKALRLLQIMHQICDEILCKYNRGKINPSGESKSFKCNTEQCLLVHDEKVDMKMKLDEHKQPKD